MCQNNYHRQNVKTEISNFYNTVKKYGVLKLLVHGVVSSNSTLPTFCGISTVVVLMIPKISSYIPIRQQ